MARIFVIAAAFVFVAFMAAGDAFAHAHDTDDITVSSSNVRGSSGRHASPDAAYGVALLTAAPEAQRHDLDDHNPADHSHPIGDDHHSQASHYATQHYGGAVVTSLAARDCVLPSANEARCGITLSPPVPPPLG